MPQATIDIQVVGGALTYTLTGAGITLGPKKHRVAKNTDIVWSCPSDFAVQFSKSPFQSNAMSVSAAGGIGTTPQKTKNSKIRKKFKYFVAVAGQGGASPVLTEDPDLEAGGDPGGGGGKRKSAPKKKKPAKKKTK